MVELINLQINLFNENNKLRLKIDSQNLRKLDNYISLLYIFPLQSKILLKKLLKLWKFKLVQC